MTTVTDQQLYTIPEAWVAHVGAPSHKIERILLELDAEKSCESRRLRLVGGRSPTALIVR